ncbi:MAG: CDP-2,3-bis-(O-geranylgeranyl)-sn-glycerol synthase [Thermoplasmata archaeon]|nr:CDP-2,3-bis-(O-geranylgeranyl)-sn-glycerol synthase [Thermoplasmata archaeon]
MNPGFYALQGLWLMVPAYLPNSAAAIFGGGKPVDFGKKWRDGRRILGDGKTWRGTLGGISAGFVIGLIQIAILYPFDTDVLGTFGDNAFQMLIVLLCLSCGSLFGDSLGSFIKRRLDIPKGVKAPILDQYDFVIGSFLFLAIFQWHWLYDNFFKGLHIIALISMLLATWFLHRAVNIIGYKMGKKEVPW